MDTCRMRGSVAVVICPKGLDEMLAFGRLKFGWLSRLNASARALSVTRSYSLKSRLRAMSTSKYPGPRKLL